MDKPTLPRYPSFYLMCFGFEISAFPRIGAALNILFALLSFSHLSDLMVFGDPFNI